MKKIYLLTVGVLLLAAAGCCQKVAEEAKVSCRDPAIC